MQLDIYVLSPMNTCKRTTKISSWGVVKKIDMFPTLWITYYNLQGDGMHIRFHKFNTTQNMYRVAPKEQGPWGFIWGSNAHSCNILLFQNQPFVDKKFHIVRLTPNMYTKLFSQRSLQSHKFMLKIFQLKKYWMFHAIKCCQGMGLHLRTNGEFWRWISSTYLIITLHNMELWDLAPQEKVTLNLQHIHEMIKSFTRGILSHSCFDLYTCSLFYGTRGQCVYSKNLCFHEIKRKVWNHFQVDHVTSFFCLKAICSSRCSNIMSHIVIHSPQLKVG